MSSHFTFTELEVMFEPLGLRVALEYKLKRMQGFQSTAHHKCMADTFGIVRVYVYMLSIDDQTHFQYIERL